MSSQKRVNKTWPKPVLFSVMLSLAIVWGHQLENNDHIELTNRQGLITFVVLTVGIHLIITICFKIKDLLRKSSEKKQEPIQIVNSKEAEASRKAYTRGKFFIIWMGIALCCFVVLLGVYPGFFVYDAQTEVTEVLTRSFTTHHPLLHVLLLGGSVAFFHKITGDYNVGIFAYTVAQMLVMTWIYTYILNFLKKNGATRLFRIITGAFFGIFPTVVMYTLCSSKDGLFSAFLVLTVILILEWEELENKAQKRTRLIWIVISAVLMMLFRHNGFYAFVVFVLFVFVAEIKYSRSGIRRRERAKFLIFPIVIYLVINTVMPYALNAESSGHQEMLTVPLQQLARVYTFDPDDFDKKEKKLLFSYISEEGLSHYTPRISDILKTYFDNEAYEKDRVSFWKLWADKGLSHPMSYVNAWLLTSYGYWYPGAVINVYQGNTVFTFTYKDSSYFGYEVEQPGERHSFIPAIDDFYRKLSIEKYQQNVPVVSLLFSPAAYFWACVFFFMVAYKRNRKSMYPFMLIFLVWLTVLLGPTYLVRYVIYLWYIIPVLILLSHQNGYLEEL